MIANQKAANLLIVGDTLHFGRVVAAILGNGALGAARQRHTTYEGFRGMLSPRLLACTDLFVLELWRTYPTGLRAEGLAVAEELIRQRARPLVVSPLALGNESGVPWYWDLGSEDSLEVRCAGLLRIAPKRWMHGEASSDRLKELLGAYLAKPQGHDA
jgi:hypothetical protein